MKKKLIILGAGTGGTILANLLSKKDTEHLFDITVINATNKHIYQPGFLYIVFNRMQEEEIIRPLKSLLNPNVNLIVDMATKIDPEKRIVYTEKGEYKFDYLVIATGSRIVPEATPGFKEAGDWFYNLEGAKRLRDKLTAMNEGRILISLIGIPHKCPVAIMEFALMLHDCLTTKGKRDNIEIVYTYPLPRVQAIPTVAERIQEHFDRANIKVKTFFNIIEVDPEKKKVKTLEDEELEFDLLVGIPEHRGAQVLIDSGLSNKFGWVDVDKTHLNLEKYANIFAIGDATNLATSKAGSVAHYQAEVLADNLLSMAQGYGPIKRYNGETFCFIETSCHEATYITFDYETPPIPAKPSKYIHWVKMSYNRLYWLTAKGIL